MDALLDIKGLTVQVNADPDKGIVNNATFEVNDQEIVGLVGGSGSGKSTTGLAILQLLSPALFITHGSILFHGHNMLGFSGDEMHKLRGKDIGIVFQEPLNAFNPVFTIGNQIGEVLETHTNLTRKEIQNKVIDLLGTVHIPDPERIARNYPHQLSGGLRQRAMIAQAIAADPQLIIADEPTSNLDVTIQAQIIELFKHLRSELKLSILLITHDLGMVEHLADRTAVMKQGRIVEFGPTQEVMNNSEDPYTKQLMDAIKV